MRRRIMCIGLSLVTVAAFAAEPVVAKADGGAADKGAGATKGKSPQAGDVVLSGLSIVGNDETPKELVIVPWKSSQLADAPGISRLLDDSTQPVDKDVFLRELAYYGLRAGAPDGD